jgi:hypothetical protein
MIFRPCWLTAAGAAKLSNSYQDSGCRMSVFGTVERRGKK